MAVKIASEKYARIRSQYDTAVDLVASRYVGTPHWKSSSRISADSARDSAHYYAVAAAAVLAGVDKPPDYENGHAGILRLVLGIGHPTFTARLSKRRDLLRPGSEWTEAAFNSLEKPEESCRATDHTYVGVSGVSMEKAREYAENARAGKALGKI